MDFIDTSIQIATPERILVDVDRFHIPDKQILFLFGESGIGKSLIARALFGLLDPRELDIRIDGQPYARYLYTERAKYLREHGFFVFQEPSSHLNPLMTVRRQLREGSLANVSGEPEILTELWQGESGAGIGNILSVYPRPYQPSGGEKQRILIAMAFKKIRLSATAAYGDSGLFVFDEASGSLDDALRNRFLTALFDRFRDHSFTTLFITHDYSMISAALALGPDIRDRFVFRELALNGERTAVKDFSPSTYTTWISGRAAKKKHAPAKNGAVLEVQSGVRVLGRWLLISRDGTETPEEPLTVHKGRITYLKAPSGAGKTSFAKALMGIIPSRNLRVRLGNLWLSEHTPESSWRQEVQGRLATMVFQHADEALNQQARVSEILDGLPLPERYRKTG
ncbi:MAG TPA: ATP-binding cassette domain-containing protein, partial [Bacteroidota bacterium]